MALNKETLALNIATDINTNTAGEVTAQDVRENMLDVVDSIFDVPGDSGRSYSQTIIQGSSVSGAVLWSGDAVLSSGTLSIDAGTTTRAPIKLASGVNLTTPEAGAIEFDGTNLYITQVSGPTRKTVAFAGSVGDALVANTLDQFADVTQTAGKTLAITDNTILNGGTHSGTNTGDQTTISGNAGSATILATARTISGTGEATFTTTAFDGSANVSGAVTLTNSAVIGKLLTGYTVGAGTVASTDTILQAFQKLDGNIALKANIITPTFTDSLIIENASAGASGASLDIYHNSASPAASDVIGIINFSAEDSGSNKTTYARIQSVISDTTDTSEDGQLVFSTMVAGSLVDAIKIEPGSRYLYDSGSVVSIDWGLRSLHDSAGNNAISWEDHLVYDYAGFYSIDWENRYLSDTANNPVLTWSSGTAVLSAGTTTKAPLKFTSGTNLTTPVAGSMEFDGTKLYYTQTTGPTRQAVAIESRTISTSAPLSGGGDLSANRTISMAAASTSVNGYLTSTDWNTFNDKAPINSPTFTGTPSLPTGTTGVTQAAATNNTTLATTAFVTTADNLKANLAGTNTFTGANTFQGVITSSITSAASGEAATWLTNQTASGYVSLYMWTSTASVRMAMVGNTSLGGRYVAGAFMFETLAGTGGLGFCLATAAGQDNCYKFYVANGSSPMVVFDSSGENIQLGRTGTTAATYGLSNAMVARVNMIQRTAAEKIQRLQTEQSSGDHAIEDILQLKQTTTNATPNNITIQTAATNYSYYIETDVIARRTAGGAAGDSCAYKLLGLFKDIAGTVTQVGTTTKTVVGESDAGCDVAFNVASPAIQLQVTGIASVSYTWHSISRIRILST